MKVGGTDARPASTPTSQPCEACATCKKRASPSTDCSGGGGEVQRRRLQLAGGYRRKLASVQARSMRCNRRAVERKSAKEPGSVSAARRSEGARRSPSPETRDALPRTCGMSLIQMRCVGSIEM